MDDTESHLHPYLCGQDNQASHPHLAGINPNSYNTTMTTLVRFNHLELDSIHLFNIDAYPNEGQFLVCDEKGFYIMKVQGRDVSLLLTIDSNDLVNECNYISKEDARAEVKRVKDNFDKQIDKKDMQIKELEMALKNPSGISEDTLLKVIEMFLQHQPSIITQTPSAPIPPYDVICNTSMTGIRGQG